MSGNLVHQDPFYNCEDQNYNIFISQLQDLIKVFRPITIIQMELIDRVEFFMLIFFLLMILQAWENWLIINKLQDKFIRML